MTALRLVFLVLWCLTGTARAGDNPPAEEPNVGVVHLRVSPLDSLVAAVVYKAGAASAFAHDHAVQARAISGE